MTKWELLPETWSGEYGEYNEWSIKGKPKSVINSLISVEGNEATFIAPKEEGPYRIFAYIYDQNGNFATTNTPFYC